MPATETNKQILIVDRDAAAAEPLRHKLTDDGFFVRVIAEGTAAVKEVADRPPHLVIIDWNMRGFAALEVIEGVRKARLPQAVRLIIISALSGEDDVVTGLNMGADDYIAKPFSLPEAVARVRAVLRSHQHPCPRAAPNCGDLALDARGDRVTVHGRLLKFLMSNPGRTFNRNQLLVQVWGDDRVVDERTVDVNVQRLRKILAESGFEGCIQTLRGFGYRFVIVPRDVSRLSGFL
jgi:two-component system phosphate regulon response regulator PhoB